MKKLLLAIAIATLTVSSYAQDILFADDGLNDISIITTTTSGSDTTSTTNTVIGLRRVNNTVLTQELGDNEKFTISYRKILVTSVLDSNSIPVFVTNAVGQIVSKPLGFEPGADTPDVLQCLMQDTGWSQATAIANYSAIKAAITKAARAKGRRLVQEGK